MTLPTLPSSLVYESLIWLPLERLVLVALESDYTEESHCRCKCMASRHVLHLLTLGTIGLVSGLIKQLSQRY